MIDAFIEFLDSLYYEGYALQLAQQDPKRYLFEMNEFFNNYGKQPLSVVQNFEAWEQ